MTYAKIKTLTGNEIKLLLDSFAYNTSSTKKHRNGIRNLTMAVMMLETGIRVGELVRIQLLDLFWDGKPKESIIIRAEIAKRHVERTIPTSILLKTTLEKFLKSSRHFMAAHKTRFAFIVYPRYDPLTVRQVQRIIKVASGTSLGHEINPHMLRHTFASRLMRVTNARVVQELLGHKSLKTTQIYCHPNGDDLRIAVDAVSQNRAPLAP